jgi:hypothetical protein
MKNHNIFIDKEQNPEFFALFDEFRVITAEYNRINGLLIGHRVPKIFLHGHRIILYSVGKQVKELHEKFLDWIDRSGNFLVHPKLSFDENTDAQTSFSHYMNVLRETRRDGIDSFNTMIGNYNRIVDSYSTQLNFLIAIISFVASFGGLIASLIGLFIVLCKH